MWSYYLHIVACIVVLTLDYQNKLEPMVNMFEQSIGLYTPPDTIESEYIDPPFYVPPLERDSTEWRTLEANRAAELILWDSPNSVIPTPSAIQIWDLPNKITSPITRMRPDSISSAIQTRAIESHML